MLGLVRRRTGQEQKPRETRHVSRSIPQGRGFDPYWEFMVYYEPLVVDETTNV